ncbi:NAD(P)-dependent oxidoreductase [Haloferax sp. Atlit-47N]|uniref:SDR family oxidoreductase n=1 Tax=Haloferax sp. Atlit-47N TaxID=2077199 RepID=UPI000E24560C|nr:SDR family oxidoreductase [Haloferax sp. Atlit-47N]RDZ38961.1 NAD(P)-dependent oxidoreductase [Haloferax sp. Atlit-47N]
MQVAVIGANGGIGRELLPRLADAGHDPVGVVRDESQFEAVRDRGGEPRLGDLEGDFESALDGADAVVFTAGSGGSTGAGKTLMVDLWGARRVVDACVEAGIDRFVMISSIGADDPLSGPEPLRPYLVAKRCADDYLEQSSLDATVLRPTALTDAEGTGAVSLAVDGLDGDTPEIPRADVAQAVVACLDIDRTVGGTMTLTGGDTPIEQALRGDD